MKKMLVFATLLMAMIIMTTTVNARHHNYKPKEQYADAPRLEIGMLYSRDSAGQYIFAPPYGMIVIHYGKTFDFTAEGLRPCTRYTLVSSNGLLIKQMRTDRNGEINDSGAWKHDEDYNEVWSLMLVLSRDVKQVRGGLQYIHYNPESYLYEFPRNQIL